jgi:hypothetical protein
MAMAEELPITEKFSIDLQWPASPGRGGDLCLDESLARFQIMVGEKSITAYQTENGDKHSYLHVPTYYLVEWLALNWWAFLYEPRKNDRDDFEQDFRSRHWLGTPRNGFALPDATFSPAGDKTEVVARPAFLRFAQLNFIESLTETVSTERVSLEFSTFISQVLEHLEQKKVRGTVAHEAWDRVLKTTKDEELYCRMIGSMGLSPYVAHPELDKVLQGIADKISPSMLEDLCEATHLGSFDRAANLANRVSQVLSETKPIHAPDLFKAQRPLDFSPRAYEWGYKASDTARSALGIPHDDPRGSAVFFDRLSLDPNAGIEDWSEGAAVSPISGGVTREDDDLRVALAGNNRAHRKFAAARAAFLAWTHGSKSSRLVTTAKTRDQQASRAFAAELLAPKKFLERKLGDRTEVSAFTLDKISEEIGVAPTVVRYQALNKGYYISEAA